MLLLRTSSSLRILQHVKVLTVRQLSYFSILHQNAQLHDVHKTAITQTKYSQNITIRNDDPNHKSPLVILFGWGNGRLKHLLKYSEIFEQKNCTTLCVTTSLINSLLRTSTVGRKESIIVRNVLLELLDKNKDRPVILYPFSNGGGAIFYMLVENMESQTFPGKNIKGTIFDSCPIIPNERSIAVVQKAFAMSIKNPALQYFSSVLLRIIVKIVIHANKDVKTFMEGMEKSNILCPQLFLFSKKDEFAPYEDILEFIDKRKNNGIDVMHKLWDDSPHVGHMQKHAREYQKLIEDFLHECLDA